MSALLPDLIAGRQRIYFSIFVPRDNADPLSKNRARTNGGGLSGNKKENRERKRRKKKKEEKKKKKKEMCCGTGERKKCNSQGYHALNKGDTYVHQSPLGCEVL